ncbi:MAG: helix-turn-helix transcriptional regulator [Prevotella sp.]|nr:helix-turn-helix transcriptional regulator [Prevotella sp.]
MDEQLKQIGERLRGLRDVLDISSEEVAALCGITVDRYEKMESGESELSVANLQKIAKKYGVSLDVLMFGEEPKMSTYFLTRKGQGKSVERRKAYQYESLASGFRGRKADPFIVTVEPKPADTPKEMNSHSGQEFNMVLEGKMELTIGSKPLILNEGDSIYFDATQPHGMRAMNDQHVKFLAIIF